MATKNPKLKKKPVARVKDDAVQLNELVALQQLQGSEGWRLLIEQMELNLAVLEQQIITKRDLNGKALSNEDVDRLRDKHGYLFETKGMPDKLIKHLKRTEAVPEEFDPYAKDVKELRSP